MAGDDWCCTSTTTWKTWTSSSSSATTCITWGEWVDEWESAATTTSASTSHCWIQWNESSHWNSNYRRVETEEQKAARLEREAEWKRKAEERKKREAEAQAKAESLLKEHLDDDQRASYEKDRKFIVTMADGTRYEFDCRKRMHNVFELDAIGKRIREFCIYQSGDTPLADNHLAQKLLLEHDPERFRRIANITRLSTAV